MKNFVKLTTATILATVMIGTNAIAGDRGHEISLSWTDTMSAAQNFEKAETAISKYCRIEAGRTNERNQSFKKRFVKNCQEQLMDGFVRQVGQDDLTTYYAAVKNPVTKTIELAAKR